MTPLERAKREAKAKEWMFWWALGSILVVACLIGFACRYYTASVQADVYRRQGVEMTTWEVFLGAKPVERPVTIKGAQ
mgnify:CR=1 FL=1|jgi:hypothetical protein